MEDKEVELKKEYNKVHERYTEVSFFLETVSAKVIVEKSAHK